MRQPAWPSKSRSSEHDDAGMVRVCRMQPHEVSAIQRDDSPSIGHSQFENGLVGERLPGLARIGHSDDIMRRSA
ncbi:MAG: hypothetical protein DMF87_16215 [Acidobacteria bacterium]|nr:MAG: hypothetical protein DMF88_26905 [Acidobacteriota bacterium]PYR77388.1 MAG: hypothetical protein DMF87_16215 [Acidobacteriota bacterium]